MKKILVYAYLNKNLGDDLFIKMLSQRYPDHRFYIAKRKSYARGALSNCKNIKFSYILEILDNATKYEVKQQWLKKMKRNYITAFFGWALRKFDATVYITGSAFVQRKTGQGMIGINRMKKRKEMSQKFFLIGANFGPYEDEMFRKGYNDVFLTLDDSCFRDKFSVEHLDVSPNIRYAPDVIFNLDPAPYQAESQEKNVLVSVIHCKRKDRPDIIRESGESYEKKVADICVNLCNKGYKINLIAFCIGQRDRLACHHIAARIEEKLSTDIKIYSYNGHITEALKMFSKADCVIATRFHAMILGWVFGKTVLPLPYDHKMKTVIHDIGFNGIWNDVEKMDELDIEQATEYLMSGKHFDITEIADAAQEQFQKLDAFLN